MELVALIQEGVPSLAAWFGATGLAAEQLGLMDTGTVVEGRRADLLICQGDVVDDPFLLDNGALVEVMKDGCGYRNGVPVISQQTYRKAMDEALHTT
jgi:imidazolonepropionase-like amidohydrolase